MSTPRISLVAFADRAGAFVFVAVPNDRGRYLRTDRSVLTCACSVCHAAIGEPCKRHYDSGTHYHATTHACRRSAHQRLGHRSVFVPAPDFDDLHEMPKAIELIDPIHLIDPRPIGATA